LIKLHQYIIKLLYKNHLKKKTYNNLKMCVKQIKLIEFENGEKHICNTRQEIHKIVNEYVNNYNKNVKDEKDKKIFILPKTALNALFYNNGKNSIKRYTPYIIKIYNVKYCDYFKNIDLSSIKRKHPTTDRDYNEEYITKQIYQLQKKEFNNLTTDNIDISKMVCMYDKNEV